MYKYDIIFKNRPLILYSFMDLKNASLKTRAIFLNKNTLTDNQKHILLLQYIIKFPLSQIIIEI